MPTGGVSPTMESLKTWFDAGVTCVGMGSKLISKDVLKSGNFSEIESKVRESIEIISSLKT